MALGEDGKTGAECFLSDMGPRPPGLSLQRIDREGNYCPENCRWAPLTRPRKRFVVFNGETVPLAQVAERVGLKLQTLVSRLRSGMLLEEAIARPLSPRRRSRQTARERLENRDATLSLRVDRLGVNTPRRRPTDCQDGHSPA